MKFVLISDTHNQHENLTVPDGDVLIHAGDITGGGSLRETLGFFRWLGNLPHQHKIFIGGNHDFLLENTSFDKKQYLPAGITYLQDTLIEIQGIKIYGSPYTPEFLNWAFMKKRGADIKAVWDKIPEGIDVLVTHGPPFKILDATSSSTNVGCEDLLDKVLKIKPKIHVFGHIHEAYGSQATEGIKFFNASVLNEHYQLVNPAFAVEL